MKIGMLGDAHGHVFHALAVLLQWQLRAKRRLDLIIQVGDLGVWPFPERADAATRRFGALDPGEFDWRRFIDAGEDRAEDVSLIRQQFCKPILFIRGNHDDNAWLRELGGGNSKPVAADPFDLFHYVPDGTRLDYGGVTMAFLGGIDVSRESPKALRNDALEALCDMAPGEVDLLITHDGPLGLAKNRRGEVRGPHRILTLVETLRPRYHAFGHHHHMIGPGHVDGTICIGLNQLLRSPREAVGQVVQPGCLGILDTESGRFDFVIDPWLADFGRNLDLQQVLKCLTGVGP